MKEVEIVNKHDAMAEWVGMPEFVQEKKEPFKTLIIRFDSEADYLDFQEKIGQKMTVKTKSVWHPFKPHTQSGGRKVYKSDK